jgi:chromosome segregation ATPase
LSALQTSNAQLLQDTTVLETSLTDAKERASEAISKAAHAQSERQRETSRCSDLECALAKVKGEAATAVSLRETVAELQEECEETRVQLMEQQQALDDASTRQAELTDTCSELQTHLAGRKKRLAVHEKAAKEYASRIEALEKDVAKKEVRVRVICSVELVDFGCRVVTFQLAFSRHYTGAH